jgi:mannose-6-phosphate isomerase-like protein (cupin superfamily)
MQTAGVNWRVVETGREPLSGRSTIVDDRRADTMQLATGRGLCRLWQTDHLLDGLDAAHPEGLFPGPNGLRLWILVIPPDGERPEDTPIHATATADFGFVLRGSVVLETDDGSSAVLHTGDAFVQAATAHRWRNATDKPAVIGVVVVGANAGWKPSRERS